MSVNNKHLATLLLGAAAAFGAYKYSNMSDEEKQNLTNKLKDKFNKLKDEAEGSVDDAKNYFADLKNKASDLFKEHFPEAEQHFNDFFKTDVKPETTDNTGTSSKASL
ncbi:MAG: YtxH domain-containing protein [Chitinophagaceae bacterium]|nr:YtxH domain-containing protein [Chitinophagaceae bacterium]